MSFSIGSLELMAVALVVIPTLVLYLIGDSRYRWLLAVVVCVVLASIMSPADIASTAILTAAFIAVFAMGSRYRTPDIPAAS